MKRSLDIDESVENKEIKLDMPKPRYYVWFEGECDCDEFDITRELTEFERTILDNVDGVYNSKENDMKVRCAEALFFSLEKNLFDGTEDLCDEEINDLDDDDQFEYKLSRFVPADKRGSLCEFRIEPRKRKPLGGPFTKIYRFCSVG